MLNDHNTPMKVIYIYGLDYSHTDNSIVIKPDIDLVVNDGDVFAIMFFKNDKIADHKISVKLESTEPLQHIFDTTEDEIIGRCPLGLDGTVEIGDNNFVVLKAKLCEGSTTNTEVAVKVNVQWANLANGPEDIYPPVMEVKVKR